MTRKDYIVIAAALKETRSQICQKEPDTEELLDGVSCASEYIADALSRDNPRFDRERFLKACGVQS